MKKYEVIVDKIKTEILNEAYKLGDLLPSEIQLQKDYGVSRHTVRQALQVLVNEGYIIKEHGSGSYVSDGYLNKNNGDLKTIGVMTTYFSEYIFPSIIRGIEDALRDKGYSIILASTNNDFDQEKQCLEMMISQNVAGLIVEPTKSNEFNPNLSYYSALKQKDIPVVMFNAFYEVINFPYVKIDDQLAGSMVTEYLIENGHSNIMLVTKSDDQQGKERMAGYIRAHVDNKVEFLRNNVFAYTTENRDEVIKTAILRIKEGICTNNNQQLTSIVCYNDDIANKIVRDLRKEGIEVPNDISIVGIDNSPISVEGEIPLTTVTHPQEEMGVKVANMIISAVEKKSELSNYIYKPKLIIRDSVKDISNKN